MSPLQKVYSKKNSKQISINRYKRIDREDPPGNWWLLVVQKLWSPKIGSDRSVFCGSWFDQGESHPASSSYTRQYLGWGPSQFWGWSSQPDTNQLHLMGVKFPIFCLKSFHHGVPKDLGFGDDSARREAGEWRRRAGDLALDRTILVYQKLGYQYRTSNIPCKEITYGDPLW